MGWWEGILLRTRRREGLPGKGGDADGGWGGGERNFLGGGDRNFDQVQRFRRPHAHIPVDQEEIRDSREEVEEERERDPELHGEPLHDASVVVAILVRAKPVWSGLEKSHTWRYNANPRTPTPAS